MHTLSHAWALPAQIDRIRESKVAGVRGGSGGSLPSIRAIMETSYIRVCIGHKWGYARIYGGKNGHVYAYIYSSSNGHVNK